jgi:hypothetical protein
MKQRFAIIAALFIAANLCADLVAWKTLTLGPGQYYSEVAYFALLSAQLSVACMWSAFRVRSKVWATIVPIAAAVAAAFAYGVVYQHRELEFVPYFILQASLLFAGLWLFKRSRFWRRRSGSKELWQFSVAHLLVLMTIVAVLTLLLRQSGLFGNDTLGLILVFLGCTVAIALLAVFIWSLNIHWFLALAGIVVSSIVLSAIFFVWDALDNHYMFQFTLYHLLTQAVVIAAALAWLKILPANDASHDMAVARVPDPSDN